MCVVLFCPFKILYIFDYHFWVLPPGTAGLLNSFSLLPSSPVPPPPLFFFNMCYEYLVITGDDSSRNKSFPHVLEGGKVLSFQNISSIVVSCDP